MEPTVPIVKNIPRPPQEIVDAFRSVTAATIHEAMGRKGAIDSRIKPIYPGMKVCGPALTCRCEVNDNMALHAALHLAQGGDVIVACAGEYTEQGLFGDVMASSALAKGVGGLVTDGCVRDGASMREMGFNVFARGLCMKGTVKETMGPVNQPISIGGQIVNPGDIVVGDDDGLVVVPREIVAEVLDACHQREKKETGLRQMLREGKTTWELGQYAESLKAKGMVVEL